MYKAIIHPLYYLCMGCLQIFLFILEICEVDSDDLECNLESNIILTENITSSYLEDKKVKAMGLSEQGSWLG